MYPILLVLTIWSSNLNKANILVLLLILILCSIIVVVYNLKRSIIDKNKKSLFKSIFDDLNIKPTDSEIIFKNTIKPLNYKIYLCTSICILAVDFRIFPSRYAKSINFGVTLMDLGVSFFVQCHSIKSIKNFENYEKHDFIRLVINETVF